MAETKDDYQFFLLRHGQSVGNFEGRYQGQTDYPLSATGVAQARSLAERWSREQRRFDRIITSPLARARQTAEIIAGALECPLEENPLWAERDVGVLSGLLPEEAAQIAPRPAFINPYDPMGQTGESQVELYLRAGSAVRSLLQNPAGAYLVVSHGSLLNMVLYVMLGITPQANNQGARFRFQNAAFAALTYLPGRHIWLLDRFNGREHWETGGE